MEAIHAYALPRDLGDMNLTEGEQSCFCRFKYPIEIRLSWIHVLLSACVIIIYDYYCAPRPDACLLY
jgi:hypothetical protein